MKTAENGSLEFNSDMALDSLTADQAKVLETDPLYQDMSDKSNDTANEGSIENESHNTSKSSAKRRMIQLRQRDFSQGSKSNNPGASCSTAQAEVSPALPSPERHVISQSNRNSEIGVPNGRTFDYEQRRSTSEYQRKIPSSDTMIDSNNNVYQGI